MKFYCSTDQNLSQVVSRKIRSRYLNYNINISIIPFTAKMLLWDKSINKFWKKKLERAHLKLEKGLVIKSFGKKEKNNKKKRKQERKKERFMQPNNSKRGRKKVYSNIFCNIFDLT